MMQVKYTWNIAIKYATSTSSILQSVADENNMLETMSKANDHFQALSVNLKSLGTNKNKIKS